MDIQTKPTQSELIAWAAGFFDGEGCWNADFDKKTGRARLKAKVTVCDKDYVFKLQTIVGGSVYGPLKPSGFGKLPRWQWGYSNSLDTIALFLAFKPFLGKRRTSRFEELFKKWAVPFGPAYDKLKRYEWYDIRMADPKKYEDARRLAKKYGVTDQVISQILNSRLMTCYISGKMRGLKDFGFPAFRKAAAALRTKNWPVVSPAELDLGDNINIQNVSSLNIAKIFQRDFAALKKCHVVALLPNYTTSEGAHYEKKIAEKYGLKILPIEKIERLPIR